jgi:2-amino-4-hydroxy-6-hydroxymethyldihydropteridine diphosphokinase
VAVAFVGLGSNLGQREALLAEAADRLAAADGIERVAVSSLYDTQPVGGPPGQPRFLNAVARLETALSPEALLGCCANRVTDGA